MAINCSNERNTPITTAQCCKLAPTVFIKTVLIKLLNLYFNKPLEKNVNGEDFRINENFEYGDGIIIFYQRF